MNITDDTAGTQRFASSNTNGVSLGATIPTTGLTVGPRQVFASGRVTQGTVPSGALVRYVGQVTLTSQVINTVNIGQQLGGFGIIPGAFILQFFSLGFNCAFPQNAAGVVQTFNYSVF